MPDKVTITPDQGKIEFKNTDGTVIGTIDTTDDGGGGSTDEISINKAKLTKMINGKKGQFSAAANAVFKMVK